MNLRERTENAEGGQILILFAMMIVVLVMFLMLVVDVGMYVMERRNTQNVMDAAALAGAQELPDSSVLAEQYAREYATRNGIDGSELVISFKCTSNYAQFCDPAGNKYDTISVDITRTAPVFFGPVVSLVGSNSCWVEGCSTSVHAAACRGACGGSAGQVDAIISIDHTGSMTATDLQNAKDGALALMRMFDYQAHNVGLAVTPPVTPTDKCDTIDVWSDARMWLPVQLNNSYQTSPNVLAAGSELVSTVSCLDRPNGELPGPHTDLAEPMKAAMNELQSNGRAGAKQGIVFFTDGAANIYGEAGGSAGNLGPCDYANKMATQAKAAGIEVYTIAYGADDRCARDSAASPWYNKTAVELLASMATDADHFSNAPRTADLDPIFQAIGAELTGGSKLVE